MIRFVGFFLLIVFFCCSVPQQAQGQFWKKWFGKKEQEKEQIGEKSDHPSPKAQAVQREMPVLGRTKFKDQYRIDVLAALYLDELVKDGKVQFVGNQIPDKAAPGYQFFQGVMLAADSLAARGFLLDIHIHDITGSKTSTDQLVRSGNLARSDLIIGAIQSEQIMPVAEFARRNQVNFISALSPSDAQVVHNPYFSLLQPTLRTHCHIIFQSAKNQAAPNGNLIFLFQENNYVDSLAYRYFREQTTGNSVRFLSLSDAQLEQKIRSSLSQTRKNIVVVSVMNLTKAREVLDLLQDWVSDYELEIYGMPSWKYMDVLKTANIYPNFGVHFTTPYYYDMTIPGLKELAQNFYQKFGGRISEMALRGFESLWGYAHLMEEFGTMFNKQYQRRSFAPFSRWEVEPRWRNSDFLYYENVHVFYYRYQGGSFMVRFY